MIARSHRLGNLLDAWYCGSLEGINKEFDEIQRTCDEGSLGASLQQNEGISTFTRAKIDNMIQNAKVTGWPLYNYSNVILLSPHIFSDFRGAVNKFLENTPRKNLSKCPYDCVVHYRVGDFLSLGQCIDLESVVEQVESTGPHDTVAVLTSGWNFDASRYDRYSKTSMASNDVVVKSKELLVRLCSLIKQKNSNTTVVLTGSDVDMDFCMMAHAPTLITAGGSFAVCAAIVNEGVVRTPNMLNTNFPANGKTELKVIRDGWELYNFNKTISIESIKMT